MSAMDRRDVLRTGAEAGAAVTVLGSGCSPTTGKNGAGSAPRRSDAATALLDFPLYEISLDEIRPGLASGELTSRSLAEAYLERIEAAGHRHGRRGGETPTRNPHPGTPPWDPMIS